jgi:phosphatidylinositol phospholipase C delta
MGSKITLFSLILIFSCFIVALNFQTGDVSMSLNHGRFTDNNQCGYILKPAILRESNVSFFW